LTGADALPCEEDEPEAVGAGAEAEACEPEVEVPCAAVCKPAAVGAAARALTAVSLAGAPDVPAVRDDDAAEAGVPA
jgi:hypothetical protein